MAVFRYTKSIQYDLGLKANVEPWLHVAVEIQQEGMYIAVFVWDTRKVVEQRFTKFTNNAAYRAFASGFYFRRHMTANDNGKKLVGSGAVVDYLNKHVMNASESGTEAYEIVAYVNKDEYDITGVFVGELHTPTMDGDDYARVNNKQDIMSAYVAMCKKHKFVPLRKPMSLDTVVNMVEEGKTYHQKRSVKTQH